MKKSLFLVVICLPALGFGQATESSKSAPQDLSGAGGPPMLGIRWARGFEPSARLREAHLGARKSPNMTYHGGKIMPTAVTQAIFWGTNWSSSSFKGDKITGLDAWYSGFGDSNYAKTSDEYTGSNGRVGPTATHEGDVIDTSPSTSGVNTSTILAEVCKAIPNPDSSGNG